MTPPGAVLPDNRRKMPDVWPEFVEFAEELLEDRKTPSLTAAQTLLDTLDDPGNINNLALEKCDYYGVTLGLQHLGRHMANPAVGEFVAAQGMINLTRKNILRTGAKSGLRIGDINVSAMVTPLSSVVQLSTEALPAPERFLADTLGAAMSNRRATKDRHILESGIVSQDVIDHQILGAAYSGLTIILKNGLTRRAFKQDQSPDTPISEIVPPDDFPYILPASTAFPFAGLRIDELLDSNVRNALIDIDANGKIIFRHDTLSKAPPHEIYDTHIKPSRIERLRCPAHSISGLIQSTTGLILGMVGTTDSYLRGM